MDYVVFKHSGQWKVIRTGLSRANPKAAGSFKLRREAVECAKKLAGKRGIVTCVNPAGEVIFRIPETPVERVAAQVLIRDAAKMTNGGRRRIAAWLIERANELVVHGKEYAGSFRGRYYYEA